MTEDYKIRFLEEDLFDAIRWLFEGAIAWKAEVEKVRHQKVNGLNTCLVQARSLYDFYCKGKSGNDDARANDFATNWNPPKNDLYVNYLGNGKAANKRIFHLVYNRGQHHGGKKGDEQDHLKEQVLELAVALFNLTLDFIKNSCEPYRDIIERTVQRSLDEADEAARYYETSNPFKLKN